MPRYLLDTNLLRRFTDPADARHALAVNATARLLNRGDEPVITSQVLIELWAVATRPVSSNGFGWDITRAFTVTGTLLSKFQSLDESARIFPEWLGLVSNHKVSGKQVHDTRLVAVMLAHGVQNLLTFNTADFRRFSEITATDPIDLLSSP